MHHSMRYVDMTRIAVACTPEFVTRESCKPVLMPDLRVLQTADDTPSLGLTGLIKFHVGMGLSVDYLHNTRSSLCKQSFTYMVRASDPRHDLGALSRSY